MFKKWIRVPMDSEEETASPPVELKRRELAESETNKDLYKPIQQLICDVHEGAMDPKNSDSHKIIYGIRRMVSMMGRVALEHERTSRLLVRLTFILLLFTVLLVIMTSWLIWLTILLIRHEGHA